jgi:hypothetical protein
MENLVSLDELSFSCCWRALVGLHRMDWGGCTGCVGLLVLDGCSWVGESLMRTAPVPTGVPAAGAGVSAGSGGGSSAPSSGSGGVSSGRDVAYCVPRVTRAFMNRGWFRLISAMCAFVLVPWGEPEVRRGQSWQWEILGTVVTPCLGNLVAVLTACVETMMGGWFAWLAKLEQRRRIVRMMRMLAWCCPGVTGAPLHRAASAAAAAESVGRD